MVLIAFDADGTLWDCRREWYDRSSEAWSIIEKAEFPMSYEEFAKSTWSVVRPEHIMQNAMLVSMNVSLPDNFNELERLRSRFDVSKHVNAFYNSRQRAMSNKEEWLGKHDLYEGIMKMLESLGGVKKTIVTSKDETSTEELLNHFKIDRFFEKVYPKELGNRSKQFDRLVNDYDSEIIVAYDDMPQNLEVARSFGFLPIAAPQGFSRPSDIIEYKSALPMEFVGIIRGLI